MPPGSHRKVIAWQRAMDLAAAVYSVVFSLRAARHWDLASQLFRASVSVPANIAEGKGRATEREFARLLDIAMGSLREVETLIELTERLHLVKIATTADLLRQSDEVGKVLNGLRRRARNQSPPTDSEADR
jgi:four helix bundle protein